MCMSAWHTFLQEMLSHYHSVPHSVLPHLLCCKECCTLKLAQYGCTGTNFGQSCMIFEIVLSTIQSGNISTILT